MGSRTLFQRDPSRTPRRGHAYDIPAGHKVTGGVTQVTHAGGHETHPPSKRGGFQTCPQNKIRNKENRAVIYLPQAYPLWLVDGDHMTTEPLAAPLGGPCCAICGRVKAVRHGTNHCETCDRPEDE